jgi:SHAQKYF class myb-like DNA-binding protein
MFKGDWKTIACMIPTRSLIQIRSHAQKHNEKLARREDTPRSKPLRFENNTAPAPVMGTGKWTASEHGCFEEGLAKHGKGEWRQIASMIPTRTVLQIRSHSQKHFRRTSSARSRAATVQQASKVEATVAAVAVTYADAGMQGASKQEDDYAFLEEAMPLVCPLEMPLSMSITPLPPPGPDSGRTLERRGGQEASKARGARVHRNASSAAAAATATGAAADKPCAVCTSRTDSRILLEDEYEEYGESDENDENDENGDEGGSRGVFGCTSSGSGRGGFGATTTKQALKGPPNWLFSAEL